MSIDEVKKALLLFRGRASHRCFRHGRFVTTIAVSIRVERTGTGWESAHARLFPFFSSFFLYFPSWMLKVSRNSTSHSCSTGLCVRLSTIAAFWSGFGGWQKGERWRETDDECDVNDRTRLWWCFACLSLPVLKLEHHLCRIFFINRRWWTEKKGFS